VESGVDVEISIDSGLKLVVVSGVELMANLEALEKIGKM
jgi:hypothetical protein